MEQATSPELEDTLWQTVKNDFSGSTGTQMLGVFAVLGWMAFQWGWGNDILLPPIVARTFDLVDDGSSWPNAIGSTIAASAAGALFWATTQTVDVLVVLSGLRLVPGITARISQMLNRHNWIKPFDELSFGTRFLIAYASGASVLCLVDVFATGEPGWRSRQRMILQAIALSVVGVAIVVVVVTTTTAIGRRLPATSEVANSILQYARNPLTWLVIYGTVIGLSALLQRLGPAVGPALPESDETESLEEC